MKSSEISDDDGPAPKKRGIEKRQTKRQPNSSDMSDDDDPAPKKRGRPPKNTGKSKPPPREPTLTDEKRLDELRNSKPSEKATYEQRREFNIARNNEFLACLHLDDIKQNLADCSQKKAEPLKKRGRGRPRKVIDFLKYFILAQH